MLTLGEALAAERARRNEEVRRVERAVLQALAQRLDAEPLPGWDFTSGHNEIRLIRATNDDRQHVSSWTMDQAMRLALGQETTEWITPESLARAMYQAVTITAKFIVDVETKEGAEEQTSSVSAGRELEWVPRRS
ncbi:MAG: hypothetical protein K8F92_04525 [Hyphomicrobium sp.]|uniref:hypothetical protein n=1 Tax=Hyphomicrobium sp. TaxID=82 RepID=UPI001328F560|nr:hypothetical protein [Hyphomicrobium sp.]KAB2943631.1 MAG: hypothetical protein F9K20_02965 [Hyphomicrobium sp.]MBZ0208904.1 hypothetical protein [Hyphomicrobium sp.]